jgi:4-amino-4-deoxy-L-arabinose transferase-like glycosyltransferase
MTREARLPGMLVLLGALLLYLPGLGATDLWAPDEPRTAQVAEEVRAGAGHRVLLHLNGEPYTQKPPLYFWLAALAGTAGDRVSAQAARLPSALAGVASVALTLALGASLLGRRTGVVAAALLLTLPSWARLARRATCCSPSSSWWRSRPMRAARGSRLRAAATSRGCTRHSASGRW